jgi:hypothetical protein
LNIFLENANNTPTNAAEITYALYDNTTGMEVLLGSPVRVPANPSVGEYYASVVIPLDANLGSYRIRWTFRETVGGPIQQVVQEFDAIDKATIQTTFYTDVESDLIRRLRILLRDNCVGGEETVELDVGGERMVVRMDDLWETLKDVQRPTS